MNDKKILEKAMQKAINRGWGGFDMNSPWHVDPTAYFVYHTIAGESFASHMYQYIYSQDFAKALWGEDKKNPAKLIVEYSIIKVPEGMDVSLEQAREDYEVKEWQYRLQQMVISDDPIKYLGENI